MPAPAATAIQQRRQELRAQQERIEAKRRKLRELAAQKETVTKSISAVQQKLESTAAQLEDTQYKYQLATQAVSQTAKQLGVVVSRFDRQLGSAKQRLRAMYKLSPNQALTYLLSATDLSSAMTRLAYFHYVANKDSQMLQTLVETKQQMESLKNQQVQHKVELHQRGEAFEQQKVAFADQKDELAVTKQHLQSTISANERELRIMEGESNAIESMLRRLIASQSRSSSPQRLGTGRFSWPVVGPITSSFGYRTHPIFKRQIFHSGLDIGVGQGVPIRAADGGRVVEAGWRGGYGKCIIVDHGGGLATLYGHCSATNVSAGQMVTKGQIIGAVGMTGYATGPHLHFEVRRDGTPVNPGAFL
ncbi:MAG: peptidoglycan DD-metalloendopeptidase family protein [Candidatus Sericytochromatia bacterium]|nr:peptidoglycan DD-metalloendopeptidase family protein [Candidatus Sericytochromatia bacterium]